DARTPPGPEIFRLRAGPVPRAAGRRAARGGRDGGGALSGRGGHGRRRLRGSLMIYALWIVQSLLALLFLFAGGMQLVLPLEQLAGPITLPGPLLRFIGVGVA